MPRTRGAKLKERRVRTEGRTLAKLQIETYEFQPLTFQD